MQHLRLVENLSGNDHEELFVARYERLLGWALQLTKEEASAADLVHDAFVQFTLSQPELSAIENLDGYLRQMLRNLHISQGRRAAQKAERPLCVTEFDSIELSLRAAEPHAGLSARDELRMVCQYALARRLSSKAASVLILRFFHGYFPAEIGRVMHMSETTARVAVKKWLSLARAEARGYLHDPESLRFLHDAPPIKIPRAPAHTDFTHALRAAIFAAPQPQPCPRPRELKAIYRQPTADGALATPLLAHLVSCAKCLDSVNRLLGIAPLSQRFPTDMTGPDDGAQSGDNARSKRGRRGGPMLRVAANESTTESLRRYRTATLEHEPTELHIYANGFLIARQTIEALRSRFALRVHLDEPLGFIEVFSEQGVRLLYLPVDDSLQQAAHIAFPPERTLDVSLSFASQWPTLEIMYDCGMRIANCELEEGLNSSQLLFESRSQSPGVLARLQSAISNPQSAIRWLLRPVTITILLTLLLLTVVVGQKLGWWLAPAKSSPTRRVAPAEKPAPERAPAAAPSVAPSVGNATSALTSAPAPSAVPALATAEMEVEALRLLQQAGADLGEQIEVKRAAQGQLQIAGLVETDARKSELLRALAPFAHHPAVTLRIETVAEAVARQRQTNASTSITNNASRVEIEKTALPIANELRAYLQLRGGDTTEAAMHELAARLHNQAHRALDHLYALQRLTKQIPPAQFDQLAPGAQAKYRTLLARHAQGYAAKTRRLREELTTILNVSEPATEASTELHSTAELYRAIAQLFAFGKSADAAIDQALTISSQATAVTAIKSSSFWRTLANAEALAAQIERFTKQHQTNEREQ